MVLRDRVYVDEKDENTLYLEPADDDGFHICEINGGKVYVYYSEIGRLIDCIREHIIVGVPHEVKGSLRGEGR